MLKVESPFKLRKMPSMCNLPWASKFPVPETEPEVPAMMEAAPLGPAMGVAERVRDSSVPAEETKRWLARIYTTYIHILQGPTIRPDNFGSEWPYRRS